MARSRPNPAGVTGLAAPPLEERAGAVTFGSAGPRPVVPCRQTESAKGCRDIRCSGASGESSRIFRRGGQPTDYPVEAAHPPKETNSFAACIGLGGNVELTAAASCGSAMASLAGMFATVHGCIAFLEGRQSSPILGGRRHRHWLVSGYAERCRECWVRSGGSGSGWGEANLCLESCAVGRRWVGAGFTGTPDVCGYTW